MGGAIPKLIHQCFFGTQAFPEALKANVEALKALNPGWRHTLYDGEMMREFIVRNYGPDMLRYYSRINPKYGAALADFFRYLLLYKVGGVYLDVKSTVLRPLDDILHADDRYILGQWDNPDLVERSGWGKHGELAHIDKGEFQQWHIMCAPGHPFLRAVITSVLANIDRYTPWRGGTGWYGTFKLTGPIAYTLAIDPLREQFPHRFIDTVEAGLEYSIFSQRTHLAIFSSHYYRLTEPIVKLSPAMALTARARGVARAIRNALRQYKRA
jgi:hypothetical protein